jgi:hypothetical protein
MSESINHQEAKMSNASHISEAARWADWLTKTESRGPGDMPNAWRRLEQRYGIPFQTFRNLRYQHPKDIWAGLYLKLKAAHEMEKQRQFNQLQHELQTARLLGASLDDLASSSSTVVDNKKAPF